MWSRHDPHYTIHDIIIPLDTQILNNLVLSFNVQTATTANMKSDRCTCQGRRYHRHEYTIVSPWSPEMCIFVSKYRKIMGNITQNRVHWRQMQYHVPIDLHESSFRQ